MTVQVPETGLTGARIRAMTAAGFWPNETRACDAPGSAAGSLDRDDSPLSGLRAPAPLTCSTS